MADKQELRELTEEEKDRYLYSNCGDCFLADKNGACTDHAPCQYVAHLRITPDGTVVLVLGRLER